MTFHEELRALLANELGYNDLDIVGLNLYELSWWDCTRNVGDDKEDLITPYHFDGMTNEDLGRFADIMSEAWAFAGELARGLRCTGCWREKAGVSADCSYCGQKARKPLP